jgi:pilus assembly protein CpaE
VTEDLRVIAVGVPPTFRQMVARALDVMPEEIDWMPSVTAAEGFLVSREGTADVLVLSPGVKDADALGLAEFVGRIAPAAAVVLVRERAPNGLLPSAMRAGVRDVVDLSQGSQDLRDALERAVAWAVNLRAMGGGERTAVVPVHRGKVVSLFSSKGGTGKTFLSCNLAVAVAELSGEDTAIVDLDLSMGDVLSYFGRDTNQAVEDVLAVGSMTEPQDVRAAGIKVADGVWAYAGQTEPAGQSTITGEAVGKFLRALQGVFPYVLVDASANYSDHSLSAFDASDSVFLVTGLDVVGVRHLSVAMETLVSIGVPRQNIRVLLNRSDSKVGLTPTEVERVMKLQVDAMIPSSVLVPMSLNKGRPVCLDEPRSAVAKSIVAIAAKIVQPAAAPAAPAAEPRRRDRWKR